MAAIHGQNRCRVYALVPVSAGEIRIASLRSSLTTAAPLVVELSKAFLQTEPQYEALSYVWGVKQSDHKLSLTTDSGRNEVFQLTITQNLAAALCQLRSTTVSRRLWVDSICIDQFNLLERNAQVQQMRRIYSQACRVIIWMGEATPHIDQAFDVFNDLERDPISVRDIDSLPKSTFVAIEEFFQRPWWTRRWVLQEAALAQEDPLVLCGHRSTSFESLVAYIACGGVLFDWGPLMNFRLTRRSEVGFRFQQNPDARSKDRIQWLPQDLLQLFRDGNKQQASDPRDHIYALLGVSIEWYRENVTVDYNSSVSQVYQQAMFAIIVRNNSLDTLMELEQIAEKSVDELPSWTKDFSSFKNDPSKFRTPNSVARMLQWGMIDNRWSDPDKIDFNHEQAIGGLLVNGMTIGTITSLACTVTTRSSLLARTKVDGLSQALETFYDRIGVKPSVLDMVLKTCNASCPRKTQLRTSELYRVLISGNTAYGTYNEPYDFDLIADTFRSVKSAVQNGSQVSDILKRLGEQKRFMLLQYLKDAVLCAHWGSAYFACINISAGLNASSSLGSMPGHIGVASRAIHEGDIVAILHGASLPAVLRPVSLETGQEGWQFITFAYIHRLVDAELVQKQTLDRDQIFTLV